MKHLIPILLACLLAACAGIDPQQYANEKPALDLPTFFNGTLDAWGVFQKRNGQVTRRFTVEIRARWQGDNGTLDERFVYADGEKQQRVWHLKRQADGSWRGTADDVAGEATGQVVGNTLHWNYVLKLPVDGKEYQVSFDDWMWQLDDKTMMNRSSLSKFGIDLGEVTLFFQKRDPS